MHILIIPSWYKTAEKPYSGVFFEEQARMFQKRGHQVGVLCPEHNLRFMGNTRMKKSLSKDYNDNGLPTLYSSTQSIVPKIERPTFIDLFTLQYKSLQKYKAYLNKYGKPDIIHAHSVMWGGVIASYISKKFNIPFFLTEHFSGWIQNEKFYKTTTYKKLLVQVVENSKKTFAVSSFLKEQLVQKYNLTGKAIDVLPNVVNDQFSYKKLERLNSNFRFTVIGNLEKGKNHLTLFKAIKLLRNKYNLRLTVIGEGGMEALLKSFTKENNLTKEIKFLGSLNKQQIIDELSDSEALISPSVFETFGVTIIESLAIGRPVIAYDSGGPRDIIREADGILIKDNTPESFADAIEKLIKNYRKYNQEDISNNCLKRFGEDSIYSKLMTYFNN